MYYVEKTFELAGSHKLKLDYDSPCSQLHGHNWLVTVVCRGEKLNECGMVVDFAKLKRIFEEVVKSRLDHNDFNIYFKQPTAELIAKWIFEHLVPKLGSSVMYEVRVQESRDNVAIYREE